MGSRDDLGNAGGILLVTTVAIAGPVFIAVVAYLFRMTWTGTTYLALAPVISIVVLPSVATTIRMHNPDPPQPSRVPVCQEHSGGDTRCPGG